MSPKDLYFTDLINLEDWQNIQDSLSEVLEVTLKTFSSDGDLISKVSRPSRLCSEILPKITKNCHPLNNHLLKSKIKNPKNIKAKFNLP